MPGYRQSSEEGGATGLADLALPEKLRLSEWQRATATALLAALVRQIEDDLRAALVPRIEGKGHEGLHAAIASAHVAILLPMLARLDPFQEPLLTQADLGAELFHDLVWTAAAALRAYMVEHHDLAPDVADEALAGAGRAVLARLDESVGLDSLCHRLARRLNEAGRLSDALVARMLVEGSLPLLLGALAVRTGLDPGACWEILSDPEGSGAVWLLRAAGIGRADAGALLLALSSGGEAGVAPLLDLYDATPAEAASAPLGLWRADPAYRAAVARFGEAA